MRRAWSHGTSTLSFTWDDFGLVSGQIPDTDTVIPGNKTDGLYLQAYTDIATNTSGDVDFYLISSPDDSSLGSYDTEPFAAMKLADGQRKSKIITGAPIFFRMRANNLATATVAKLKATIKLF